MILRSRRGSGKRNSANVINHLGGEQPLMLVATKNERTVHDDGIQLRAKSRNLQGVD